MKTLKTSSRNWIDWFSEKVFVLFTRAMSVLMVLPVRRVLRPRVEMIPEFAGIAAKIGMVEEPGIPLGLKSARLNRRFGTSKIV